MDHEMTDMYVSLLHLPSVSQQEEVLKKEKVIFRKPLASELDIVVDWVEENFGIGWASEMRVSMSQIPVACLIAQRKNEIVGFACYEASMKNFFGPTGVLESYRGKKIGEVLLVKALMEMKNMGYAYAIIGGVGPVEYYKKVVGARIIEGSGDSIYKDSLVRPK